MGGGGFSMEPENPLLDSFLISLAGKRRAKVCFVGTASGDDSSYRDKFYDAMKGHDVEPSHLSLFKPPVGSLEQFVLSQDIIYVGGGNTRNLMALWKEWRLDSILKRAYANGVVMGGISAGSLCWFEEGVTDSITGSLTKIECMGILKGSNCPHYDGEVERRSAYHALIKDGMKPGVACDDGVAGYFVDEHLVEFVSSRPNAKAYRLTIQNQNTIEVSEQPRYLAHQ